jgi:hypothetical protein
MNVEIGTEAPIILFWEYLFQIFGILYLQCREYKSCSSAKVFRCAVQAGGYKEMLSILADQ